MMRAFLLRWVRHAALNAGDGLRLAWAALSCVVFVPLPPQLHHSEEDLRGFDRSTAWREFRRGLLDRE